MIRFTVFLAKALATMNAVLAALLILIGGILFLFGEGPRPWSWEAASNCALNGAVLWLLADYIDRTFVGKREAA